MGGGYPPVIVNVSNNPFVPLVESFGVPIIIGTVTTEQATAWALLDTPRTLEVSPNNYKAALASIKMTAADAHWKHVEQIFAQRPPGPRVTKVILGRRLTPTAKVVRVTVGGTTDGNYSIQVDADDPLVYAAAGKTAAEIRDALLALFAGHPTVSAATQGAASIDFTAVEAGYDFTLTLASPGGILTQTTQTPNVGPGEDLTALRAENSDWFDILETSHSKGMILEVAKWAQTNQSHAWMETNDAAVKANTAGNVAAMLRALGLTETSIRYHHTGAQLFTAGLFGHVGAFLPGQIQVSHRKLVGVTPKNYGAEAGVTTNFSTNNVGYYDARGGGTTLYNYVCADGRFIESERNKWVVKSRAEFSITVGLQNNNITAYTDDEGVVAVRSWVTDALNQLATGGGTGYIIRNSIVITTTPIADQQPNDQAKLKIGGVNVSARVRIGTNEVEVNIFLSIIEP
mgnify:CR=1 FL=1